MNKNKIALFLGQFHSWSGLLIALGTRCEIVHAAVYVASEGRWYDSSERRGDFNLMDTEYYAERECYVFEFDGDLSDWLKSMKGTQYDWMGIIAWALFAVAMRLEWAKGKTLVLSTLTKVLAWSGKRLERPKQFFCFETAASALAHCGYPVLSTPIKGCDLRNLGLGQGVRFVGAFKRELELMGGV